MSRVFRSGNNASRRVAGGRPLAPLGCCCGAGLYAGRHGQGRAATLSGARPRRLSGAAGGRPGVAGELQHPGRRLPRRRPRRPRSSPGCSPPPTSRATGRWSRSPWSPCVTLVAFGQTPGMRLLGLRLAHPRPGQRLALWRAVVRTALLCLLVPGAAGRRRRPRPARPAHRHRRRPATDRPSRATGDQDGPGRSGTGRGLPRRDSSLTPRRRTWRWLTDICLPPGSGPPGTGMRAPPRALIRWPSALTSAGGQVAGQLHDVVAELAQRDLALVVADDDVVDRGVADDAGDLLLLLREQAADPAGHALGDEDDPGPAEHAVDGVQLLGAGDAGGDPPVTAHALEHPRGRSGLALDLAVGRALGPPAEDDERGQTAGDQRQREEDERASSSRMPISSITPATATNRSA